MRTPKSIGPLVLYSWGWDIQLSPWRNLWLTYVNQQCLYLSRDGTPEGSVMRIWGDKRA